MQDPPLLGIVGFDFLLDILRPGKDRTVGNTFEYRFDRIVGRGFVPADFDQDIPRVHIRNVVRLPQHRRLGLVERRPDLEIAVDTCDLVGIRVIHAYLEFFGVLRNTQFPQGVLVDEDHIVVVHTGEVVVAQPLQPQYPEIGRIADEYLEPDHPVGAILHRIVVAPVVGRTAAQGDGLDTRLAQQLLAELRNLFFPEENFGRDIEYVGRIVPHRRRNQVADLQADGQRGGDQDNGNDVLDRDKHLAVKHLGAVAERSPDDVHGFVARHHHRRDKARNDAQHHDKRGIASHDGRRHILPDADFRPQQPRSAGLHRGCQEKRDDERHDTQECRFEDQFEDDFAARGAQQPAGGHLLGAKPGLGNRQVDIIHHGEEQDDGAHTEKDHHEGPTAVVEPPIIILG